MNSALIDWVREHSPAENGAYVVHLTLAFHADVHREVRRSQADLAVEARMNVETLRRQVRSLVADGLVEIIENASKGNPARLRISVDPSNRRVNAPTVDPSKGRANRPSRARRASDAPLPTQLLPTEEEPAGTTANPTDEPSGSPGRQILVAVMERCGARKPATHRAGIVATANALLRAGHEPERIIESMLAVPTISIGWCEAWLNGRKSESGATAEDVDAALAAEPARPRGEAWVCGVGNPNCHDGLVDDPDAPVGTPVHRCECVKGAA